MQMPPDRYQFINLCIVKFATMPDISRESVLSFFKQAMYEPYMEKLLTPDELVAFQGTRQECVQGIFNTKGVSKQDGIR